MLCGLGERAAKGLRSASDEFHSRHGVYPWVTIAPNPMHGEGLMPETEPTAELNEGFSGPDATARPWAEVVDVLSQSEGVLAVDRAPRWATACHAAPGDLA